MIHIETSVNMSASVCVWERESTHLWEKWYGPSQHWHVIYINVSQHHERVYVRVCVCARVTAVSLHSSSITTFKVTYQSSHSKTTFIWFTHRDECKHEHECVCERKSIHASMRGVNGPSQHWHVIYINVSQHHKRMYVRVCVCACVCVCVCFITLLEYHTIQSDIPKLTF